MEDEEGEDDEPGGDGGEDGEELEDGDREEENVGYPAELLEEVAGEEGEDGVLGGDDLVGRIEVLLLDPLLVVVVLWRDLLVDEHRSWRTGLSFSGEQRLYVERGELVVPAADTRLALGRQRHAGCRRRRGRRRGEG